MKPMADTRVVSAYHPIRRSLLTASRGRPKGYSRENTMDKLVRRVTVVEGAGENRREKVVYENHEDENVPFPSFERSFPSLESAVRYRLKLDLVRAKEAYARHIGSASRRKGGWLFGAPSRLAPFPPPPP